MSFLGELFNYFQFVCFVKVFKMFVIFLFIIYYLTLLKKWNSVLWNVIIIKIFVDYIIVESKIDSFEVVL